MHTKQLIIFSLALLAISCTPEKKSDYRDFADLNKDEKIQVFEQFGDSIVGDFLLYTGYLNVERTSDWAMPGSTNLIELALDRNHRFVVRTSSKPAEVETDSITVKLFGHSSNKGMGLWSDQGDWLELKFQLGSADNYFSPNDTGQRFKMPNDKTVRFSKAVDTLWIWRTPCLKQ